MSDQLKYPNSGIAFPNDFKKEPKHPDMRGSCDVECLHCGKNNHFDISLWHRSSAKGEFETVKFSPPRDRREDFDKMKAATETTAKPANAPVTQKEKAHDDDEDVPF